MDAQSDDPRLGQALAWEYAVEVRRKGKGYAFFLRELGLRHESEDLARGHAGLLEKKDALLRELAAEGLWDWMTPPGRPAAEALAPRVRLWGLGPFLVKYALVAVLLIVAGGFVSRAAREAGYVLEKKLDNLVVLTPEQVEHNRQKTRAIVERIGPIVRELAPLFQTGAQAGALPGAAGSNATRDMLDRQ